VEGGGGRSGRKFVGLKTHLFANSLIEITELTFIILVFTIYFHVPIILIRHTL